MIIINVIKYLGKGVHDLKVNLDYCIRSGKKLRNIEFPFSAQTEPFY